MSCFDEVINRRQTDSEKWGAVADDVLPLWVADMDFASPKPITDAIIERAQHGVYGYASPDAKLTELIIQYYKTHHQTTVLPEWVVWLPNVNVPVNLACRTAPGNLLMCTPIYSHMYMQLPKEAGKERVAVPLIYKNNRYTFDFDAMQKAAKEQNVGVFILCNPHNPLGISFSKQELQELLDFAIANNIFIVSDEIHSDLIWDKGVKHVPFFTLGEQAYAHSITLHAATKTYNLAGAPLGFAIIPDEAVRERFKAMCNGLFPSSSVFALAAYHAAFTQCEDWRQELLTYLKDSYDYIQKRLEKINGLTLLASEGTYLAFVDARDTGLENPYEFLLQNAKVRFGDGAQFGNPGFIRINYGCPRSTLKQALDQTEQALNNL